MRAVVMKSSGDADVLGPQEVSEPTLREGTELLVRLKAAGVNPVDTKMRVRAAAFGLPMPAVLGCDGAGVVEEIGAGVAAFKPGDEVYFCQCGFGGRSGNYAQYAVVDERLAAKKPSTLSFAEAAAAPLVLITAWESLHDRTRAGAGQRVLIHGGAGGVGHVALQLAKIAGAQVCTTVSSEEKAAFVRGLGCEEAILYKQEDFADAALRWTHGEGVDVALDTVGGQTLEQTFRAVRCYGDLVTILQPPEGVNWSVARQRNLRISLELMLSPVQLDLKVAQRHQGDILRQCAELFEERRLRIHVAETFPLDEAAEAHRRLEAGSMTGKIVLAID